MSIDSSNSRVTLAVDASVAELIETHKKAEEEGEDDDPDRRQTQLYCGSCCDMLCASLTVNCLYVPWMIHSVMFNLSLYKEAMEMGLVEEDSRFNPLILLAVKNGIGVVFGLIGILGCCKMYKYCVLATGIWFCVDIVWSCVSQRYVMLCLVFNIYPHFYLFEALWSGNITRDNYRWREKHCCCKRKQ